MRTEVLDFAARKNIFLCPDALDIILSNSRPIEFATTVLNALSENSMFVTAEDVTDFISGESTMMISPKPITPKNKRQPDLTVIKDTDVTGESVCEGKIEDFARYFKNRFQTLKRMIQSRRDFGRGISIKDLDGMNREIKTIGIVSDISYTKNAHRMITLEDDTGTCKVMVLKDTPVIGNDIIVNDEVIGIIGRTSGSGIIMVSEIFRPEIPAINGWEASDSVSSVAFLSDVHVGSHTFLEERWKNMIKWMKENAYEQDIDYLIFPGDVVDGIGIFPGQQEELDIHDIYGQYEKLAEYLKDFPDHVKMVIHPGNHDAVRPAEPQPALSEVFTKTFDSNVMMVGNPVSLNIEGRTVLTYHGRSIDDWVSSVQKLTYEDPVAIMKEMLSRRHLAPIYGQKTALAPERKDYMLIEHVPDIFITGHVHGAGYINYRGVRTINASAWQDQTDYQKMHNFNPDPAVMPMVHLGTGKVNMKRF